jgi:hypothetical protein
MGARKTRDLLARVAAVRRQIELVSANFKSNTPIPGFLGSTTIPRTQLHSWSTVVVRSWAGRYAEQR